MQTRKLVTVLFCDVVGSTELAGSLDAESLHAVLARYFDRMRAVLQRHGGLVEKFIGDAVMAVFGVPAVHEDDAIRAVRAAVDMRHEIASLNRELERERGMRLMTRVGIASGEVLVGEPDGGSARITGSIVNLAARLEQSAGPDEIVLGAETHRLVRDAVQVEELEPLTLKGFGDPVPAFRLASLATGTDGHARRFDSPIVDRESERSLLEQTLDRVIAARRCQLFTLLGSPGIGKSRLVDEFLGSNGDRALTLQGRCLSYGTGITFWPVAEVVEQATGVSVSDDRERVRRELVRILEPAEHGQVIAERVGQAIGLTPGAPSPDELLWAIRRFLETLAARPLVLVFDDIHWAEPTFLDLIEHVADRSRDTPIMLLCVARPELFESRPSWGGGKLNSTTILLEPLASDDVDHLLANLLTSGDLAPDARRFIARSAGGNPLFAEEIVSVLIEEGTLVLRAGLWTPSTDLSTAPIPSTISGLLAARLDRLEPSERATLQRASVIGRDFSVHELGEISPPDDRRLLGSMIEALADKELIRSLPSPPGEDRWRFRHILIRDVAYEGIAKGARADLHQRYADLLEDRAGHRLEELEEIVGHHLEQAYRHRLDVGPSDDRLGELGERAGRRFAAAGLRAVARGDTPATVKLLTRAAELLPAGDRSRIGLLPYLADGLFQEGDRGRAESLLDEMRAAAADAGDPVLVARAELERYTWRLITEPSATSGEGLRRVAERAVHICEERGEVGQLPAALESLTIAHRLVTGDAAAMLEASERGLGLARELDRSAGAPVGDVNLEGIAEALILGSAPYPEVLVRLEELGATVRGPMAQATVGVYEAFALARTGRFAEARARSGAAAATFDDLGQRRWSAQSRHTQGLIDRWEGHLEAAEERIRDAHRFFADRGEASDAAFTAIDLADVLYDLDRLDEAERVIRSVEREMPDYALEPAVAWRGIEAKILARRSSAPQARRLARDAVRIAAATDFAALHAGSLYDLSVVLSLTGRPDEAAEAAARSLELFERKADAVGVDAARALSSAADR